MKSAHTGNSHLRDFTTDPRVLLIAAIAVVVATAGLFAGIALLKLIRLATNIAYFGQFTLAELRLEGTPLGLAAVIVPVLGALIIGLMARFGSEKIRGHGIPEAIEAILLGRSRLDAKVAAEAAVVGDLDRLGRTVRRRRPDHYDRRRHRLADRADAAGQRQ